MPMTRRAGALLALLLAASPAAQAQDLIPFRMGISAPAFTILPVHFADAGGFYEKNGLKVEIINAEGGTRGIQVLLPQPLGPMTVMSSPSRTLNRSTSRIASGWPFLV